MLNYFVKVSGFLVKGQRKLKRVGVKRWRWGGWARGGKGGESRSLYFL